MVAVSVPPGGLRLTLTGFDYYKRLPAPDYYIDRHEVTNAEFKAFVDAGGYEKREYWTEPFVREGQTLDWSAAMALFRDGTGRPGPATWQGGTYPAGQEDWPVAAVSWYEAAAYAAFRGKHLPTIYHWTHAARPELGNSITRSSHFGGGGPVRGGHRAAVSGLTAPSTWPATSRSGSGTSRPARASATSLAVRGTIRTTSFSTRIPGRPSTAPTRTGFAAWLRTARRHAPRRAHRFAATAVPTTPLEQPVADAVYRIYADQYSYDRTPFDVRVESTDDASPLWRHEVVSMAAVYGGERMPVHLYLPKNVKPPYQAVLFFPGSIAIQTEQRDPAVEHVWNRLHRHERPRAGVSGLQVHLRAERPTGHVLISRSRREPTPPGCSSS